jgi:hypothetical protein
MMTPARDHADFSTWLKTNPTPDLQTLVAQYGGYSAVPAEAWADYDRARWTWECARRDRLFGSGTWMMLGKKPSRRK